MLSSFFMAHTFKLAFNGALFESEYYSCFGSNINKKARFWVYHSVQIWKVIRCK